MTAIATVEHTQGHIDDYPEGPVVRGEEPTRIERVEDLPDELRKVLVARREAGTTLAELKRDFAWVASDVIREVLPPANARERKARERKEAKPKVTESKQGIGGRSGEAKSEPKPKAEPKEPKPPRYAEGEQVIKLAERTLAARQVVGRNRLAELLEVTGSAVWRFEQRRIHPDEAGDLDNRLDAVEDRINRGEFVKAERQPKAGSPSKAELQHRVETVIEFIKTVRGDKSVSKPALADGVLALLDPPVEAATETQ